VAGLAPQLADARRRRRREVWLQTELVVRGSTAEPSVHHKERR
jgi:hypothetical protein